MITTTLERIRKHRPCEDGWTKLLGGLGKTKADDEPLPFARIIEINGLQDALWCCRAEPQYDREWRLFAVWCVRQVQHLIMDPRLIAAIDVAERYAHGQATEEELSDARIDAVHFSAVYSAAYAVCNDDAALAACFAAVFASADAGRDAATKAEWYVATAARAATAAEATAAQTKEFLRVVNETEGRAVASISEYEGVLR